MRRVNAPLGFYIKWPLRITKQIFKLSTKLKENLKPQKLLEKSVAPLQYNILLSIPPCSKLMGFSVVVTSTKVLMCLHSINSLTGSPKECYTAKDADKHASLLHFEINYRG
jgi:hypothetical protein